MAYTFGTTIVGDIDDVRLRVIDALKAEGFGVLTEIDVAATMKAKLGETMAPYVILGACNPSLAFRALALDGDVGALLPCNVVLRDEGDGVAVRFMDPGAVLGLVEAEGIDDAADEARQRLGRVAEFLDGRS
jgi:uncharacterized protein (DUF302 family)